MVLKSSPPVDTMTRSALLSDFVCVDPKNSVWLFSTTSALVGGLYGDGAGWAGPGSLCARVDTGALYVQGGTKSNPAWKSVAWAGDVPTLDISGTPGVAVVRSSYSFIPTITGASGPVTATLFGPLPYGMSFDTSTGALTGTPLAAQDVALTIMVTDGSGHLAYLSFTLVIDIPLWADLVSSVPAHYYVSNAAENGRPAGNDTTGNGLSWTTAWATIDKGAINGIDGALIEVNPTSVPYVESTAGAGWLRLVAAKGIVVASDSSVGRFTLRATGSRVVLLDTSTKLRLFRGAIIDGTGSTGTLFSASSATQINLYLEDCLLRNTSASTAILQKPIGSNNVFVMNKCDVDDSVAYVISATGGAYSSIVLGGSTFSNSNQIYKGAVGGSVTTFVVEGNAINGHASGTGTGIIGSGETITTLSVANNSSTGSFASPVINLASSVAVTTWRVHSNTGNPNKGWLLCNSPNVTSAEIAYNTWSTVAGQTSDPATLRVCPTALEYHHNVATNYATAQVKLISIGGDGYNADNANTTATGTQNLGQAAGNTYVTQKFTMAASTATIKANTVAAILVTLKKVGSPVATVVGELWTDSAGALGSLVATSTNTISATALTTTAAISSFRFETHPTTTPSGLYHLKMRYTGTVDGTNYVQLSTNTTVTGGSLSTSTDGTTWTNDATHAIIYEVDTGSFHTTSVNVYSNRVTSDPTASATTHGALIGAVNLTGYWNNEVYGPGIGHLFKNTSGGLVYDLVADIFAGSQPGLYFKGCSGIEVAHVTIQQRSSNASGSAVLIGSNSELGANAPVSTGRMRNSILINSGSGLVYGLDPGALTGFTLDYNLVFKGPLAAGIATGYASWALWQGAGADAHSVNADPLLPATMSAANDFIPPANSPAGGAGTDLSALVPTDFNGAAWVNHPAGAFNLAA